VSSAPRLALKSQVRLPEGIGLVKKEKKKQYQRFGGRYPESIMKHSNIQPRFSYEITPFFQQDHEIIPQLSWFFIGFSYPSIINQSSHNYPLIGFINHY
jgi:hypothetical protein